MNSIETDIKLHTDKVLSDLCYRRDITDSPKDLYAFGYEDILNFINNKTDKKTEYLLIFTGLAMATALFFFDVEF